MGRRQPSYQFLIDELIRSREAAGLTQVSVAERLGRPQSFVSKYESGERRLDMGEFIEAAQAIGVDPVELVKSCVEFYPTPKKGRSIRAAHLRHRNAS